MKKLLGVLVVVLLVVVGWMWVRQQRVTAPWNEPKWAQVTRGDIRVPITAAGLIEPNQRIEVKSKASGKVIELNVVEGKFVKTGEVLVKLEQIDEQRNVTRAGAALDRANSALATASVEVEKTKHTVDRLAAQVEQLKAQGRMAQADLDDVQYRIDKQLDASHRQLTDAKANFDINAAQVKGAEAELKVAENNVSVAEENVKTQEAFVTEASETLREAEKRLSETTIIAPQDSIVTKVEVRVGEVIQGGQSTFTGGTILVKLADVSKKKVVTRVDESDYGRIVEIAPAPALPQMPRARSASTNGDPLEPTSQAATRLAGEIEQRAGKVELTVDAFPEDRFGGVIERVEPQGNLNVGSSIIQFNVVVEVTDEKTRELPLGAQAQVEFTVESARDVLRIPAEAAKSFQGERGVWVKVPPPAGSNERYGKKFVACRFGITDGTFTHVIQVLHDESLTEKDEVYTKVPTDDEEKDDRP